jgi:hypothetical protein
VRNYILIKCLPFDVQQIPPVGPTVNFTEALWGISEAELNSKYIARQAVIRSNIPADTYIFTPRLIQNIYWCLDRRNFVNLLDLQPTQFWLYSVGSKSTDNAEPALEKQTRLDESPRPDFPTELGTDGQRLKHNKSENAGQALNYIGRLYFLSSNPAFKQIFDALKSGKLTEKQALAKANALT